MSNRFKEVNQLMKNLEEAGCTVRLTRKNHFKITTPSGQIVTCPGTASDFRAFKNAKSELRKAGVSV